jgi:hypothetical protein
MVGIAISKSTTPVIDDFLKDECSTPLTAAAIGDTFVIEGSHFRKIWRKPRLN